MKLTYIVIVVIVCLGSGKTKENLDKLMLNFCSDYQNYRGPITPGLVVSG